MDEFAPVPFDFTSPRGMRKNLRNFNGFARIAHESSHLHGIAWRGLADADWRLTSSAFRAELNRIKYYADIDELGSHATDIICISDDTEERMKHASRRVQKAIGTDPHLRLLYQEQLLDKNIHDDPPNYNELLATCQHFGMETPLIDVTDSAFVALFFAASDALRRSYEEPGWGKNRRFAVWKIPSQMWREPLRYVLKPDIDAQALAGEQVALLEQIQTDGVSSLPHRSKELLIANVFPRAYRNERLIAQQGSFVRVTPDLPLDHVISMMYVIAEDGTVIEPMHRHLIQYTLPVSEALDCLTHLAKMNIRSDTLFPDMTGQMGLINLAANHYDYAGMTSWTRGSRFHMDGSKRD